jgi:hypothetical protein
MMIYPSTLEAVHPNQTLLLPVTLLVKQVV